MGPMAITSKNEEWLVFARKMKRRLKNTVELEDFQKVRSPVDDDDVNRLYPEPDDAVDHTNSAGGVPTLHGRSRDCVLHILVCRVGEKTLDNRFLSHEVGIRNRQQNTALFQGSNRTMFHDIWSCSRAWSLSFWGARGILQGREPSWQCQGFR